MDNHVKVLFHRTLPTTPPTQQQSDGTSIPEDGHQWLPLEVVEMIVSYVHDFGTLRSCSLTCRIWYYATRPRFHYSLKAYRPKIYMSDNSQDWPKPLLKAHEFHLLPCIKRFSILITDTNGFTRRRFGGGQNLYCFSALRSLQELRIDDLRLSGFMPNIKKYFGHFPTLRSLTLRQPKASCRQLLYFIGLFPDLQDLKLLIFDPAKEDKTTDKSALVPPSKPPLGGWLTLISYNGVEFVNEMIAFYGKLPFHRVNISHSDWECAQRVVNGCAKTLETWELVLATGHDLYGEHSFGYKGKG
jgi:hypothetical protein